MKNLVYSPFRAIVLSLTAAALFSSAVFAQTGIKGKIRTNSGDAIPNATVTISKEGKEIKSARSRSDGEFLISGVDPGTYSLRVDAKGYASGSLSGVEIKKDKLRDLGSRLFLRVDQGSQVILNGSVFFKEGTSVTRAKVELEAIAPDGSARRIGKTETNVSGEFTFKQPEGITKYRVTATYNGVAAVKEIDVANAAVYRVALMLDLSSTDK
jgi:hypothetical protein